MNRPPAANSNNCWTEIKRISGEISSDSARKNDLQQQLRAAELELGRLRNETAANERAITASREQLADLQQQRQGLEQARDQQQARIALELKPPGNSGNKPG